MRITTANAYDRSIETLQSRQRALVASQEIMTSGKKVARASDDPTNAARAERALAQEARADASQRALEASRASMTLAEQAMGDAGDLMQSVRELVIQAGNASFGPEQRKSIANELRGLRNQLLQVANRTDGAGGYLFNGQGSSQQPFIDAPGGVQYNATPGSNQVASGENPLLPITADGNKPFLQAMTGNGVFAVTPAGGNSGGAWAGNGSVTDPSAVTGDPYSFVFAVGAGGTTVSVLRNGAPTAVTAAPYVSGQAISVDGMSLTVNGTPANGDTFDVAPSTPSLSVFDALDRIVTGLSNGNATAAQVSQTVQSGLGDVDSAMSAMTGERARLGEVLKRTDAVESRIADSRLVAQSDRSSAEDADMVKAVSDFSKRQTSYDAALKAYSMVQKLSLFDYIR